MGVTQLASGPRPDITPPQIAALVIAGIPILAQLLRAFGIYDLDGDEQEALSNAVTWASVLAGALIGGDAVLRTGRNIRRGQVESALAAGGEGDNLEIVQSGKLPPNQTVTGTTYRPQPPVDPIQPQPGAITGFEEPPPPPLR